MGGVAKRLCSVQSSRYDTCALTSLSCPVSGGLPCRDNRYNSKPSPTRLVGWVVLGKVAAVPVTRCEQYTTSDFRPKRHMFRALHVVLSTIGESDDTPFG